MARTSKAAERQIEVEVEAEGLRVEVTAELDEARVVAGAGRCGSTMQIVTFDDGEEERIRFASSSVCSREHSAAPTDRRETNDERIATEHKTKDGMVPQRQPVEERVHWDVMDGQREDEWARRVVTGHEREHKWIGDGGRRKRRHGDGGAVVVVMMELDSVHNMDDGEQHAMGRTSAGRRGGQRGHIRNAVSGQEGALTISAATQPVVDIRHNGYAHTH